MALGDYKVLGFDGTFGGLLYIRKGIPRIARNPSDPNWWLKMR
jgi:hypothetical protein